MGLSTNFTDIWAVTDVNGTVLARITSDGLLETVGGVRGLANAVTANTALSKLTGLTTLSYAPGSPALGATTAVHAAVTDTGAPVTVTTAITNPDVPRNITATAGGTNTDIKAIQVVVTGTDINDAVLTETLPVFTVDTAGTVVGNKAFKTVTSVAIPAHDGTGATTAIGTGAKLGLPSKLSVNTVDAAYLATVKEGTAPTVAVSSTVFASNTVTLNSALNAGAVVIIYRA